MDKDLIFSNINFLKDYLPKIIKAIDELVELLITNKETQSLILLNEIFEGLDWVIRSASGLQNLGYIEGINIDSMGQLLVETEQAFNMKDYVLLGDLLQYEIAEILTDWLDKLVD